MSKDKQLPPFCSWVNTAVNSLSMNLTYLQPFQGSATRCNFLTFQLQHREKALSLAREGHQMENYTCKCVLMNVKLCWHV